MFIRVSMTCVQAATDRRSFLQVEGDLRVPLNGELRRKVQALIDRGQPTIVLNLARVSQLDAAGIGELVGVYKMALAENRALRIAHATGRVRRLLDRVGLFDLLTKPKTDQATTCPAVLASRLSMNCS
jgi:anti-anti-sigma factor